MYNKLNELDTFLSETFKIIDPTNELEQYKSSLKSIREDIMLALENVHRAERVSGVRLISS